jgi:pimeloyl-CoA synthetase
MSLIAISQLNIKTVSVKHLEEEKGRQGRTAEEYVKEGVIKENHLVSFTERGFILMSLNLEG